MTFFEWLRSWFSRPPDPPPPGPTPSPSPDGLTQQLLEAHNAQRAAHGKSPLRVDPLLQKMAQAHADTMAKNGIMSHGWAGDGSFGHRIDASGYAYVGAGENVAFNQSDVPEVMKAWMNSPGHRANILGAFVDAGLAMARSSKGAPYWSTCFCKPARASIPLATARPWPDPPPDPPHIAVGSGFLLPPVTLTREGDQ